MVLVADQAEDQLLCEANEVATVFQDLLLDLVAIGSIPVPLGKLLGVHWYSGREVEATDVDLLKTGLHENQIFIEVKVKTRRHGNALIKLSDLELVKSKKGQRVKNLPIFNAAVVGECIEHLEEQ